MKQVSYDFENGSVYSLCGPIPLGVQPAVN